MLFNEFFQPIRAETILAAQSAQKAGEIVINVQSHGIFAVFVDFHTEFSILGQDFIYISILNEISSFF